MAMALALNGCIALGLNIVSFTANNQVGALGMTVAGTYLALCTFVMILMSISQRQTSPDHLAGRADI